MWDVDDDMSTQALVRAHSLEHFNGYIEWVLSTSAEFAEIE